MGVLKTLWFSFSVTVKDVRKITGLSPEAANDLVKEFIEKEILKEMTGYQRNRTFVFNEYVKMF